MKNKNTGQFRWTTILKCIFLGGIAALVPLLFFLPAMKQEIGLEQEPPLISTPSFDALSTEEVRNKENAALQNGYWTFLDQPPEAPAEEDAGKKVFRIIEVIPHDACSIFPYLVEWGSVEEYNKRVPMGYEGILAMASTSGLEYSMFGNNGYYHMSSQAIARDTFDVDNYDDIPMGKDGAAGRWYRTTENTISPPVSGYFEFVGTGTMYMEGSSRPAGNGLYYIAPTFITDNPDGQGIRYEIQPVPRTGKENQKGELYVKSPEYYRIKAHENVSFPNIDILGWTDYNYDLSFMRNQSTGKYQVDFSLLSYDASGGNGYDYILNVDKPDEWESGFHYLKGGNYKVKEVNVNTNGAYVREESDVLIDGYEDAVLDLKDGYFRLYQNPSDLLTTDGNRYDVLFEETAVSLGTVGTGTYGAIGPDSSTNDSKWTENQDYSFQYIGEGKGFYKLFFKFAGSPKISDTFTRYQESLIRLTNGLGEYSLASSEKDTTKGGQSHVPLYVDPGKIANTNNEPLDYANVIINIEYVDGNSSYTDNDRNGRGVMSGATNTYDPEKGAWVFHRVTDPSKMGITLLSEIHQELNGQNSNQERYFANKTRIYVNNQVLRLRHYNRNNFKSNELFKLLCFSNHPLADGLNDSDEKSYGEMINGIGYNKNQSGEQNLGKAEAKALIEAFDSAYRIQIEQISPAELTSEKILGNDSVPKADLVYISYSLPINGLATAWNGAVSSTRAMYKLPPLRAWPGGGGYSFNAIGDINTQSLMTLYDECIANRRIALIMDGTFSAQANNIQKNLTKLYFLMNYFRDARNFKYFMPDMYGDDYNPDYTRINGNQYTPIGNAVMDLDVYMSKNGDFGNNEQWRRGKYNQIYIDEYADKGVNRWNWSNTSYFTVHKESNGSVSEVYPFTYNENANWLKVLEDETKLTLGDYAPGNFNDAVRGGLIWEILRNRGSGDDYEITVVPTNADMIETPAGTRWVIYGNEMDQSFDIEYQVLIVGSTAPGVTISGTTCVFEDGSSLAPVPIDEEKQEYRVDARSGFEDPSSTGSPKALDPYKTLRTVTITATDSRGKSGSVDVDVIVREAFNLN